MFVKNRLPTILTRQWTLNDLQNSICGIVLTIDFFMIQAPLIIKSIIAGLFITSFFIPYIKRFTIPALPIFTWLFTLFAYQFIPLNYRPTHIFVNLLPTLERILYGANLSEIISKHTHPVLDILAWLPYGIIHFGFPFVLAFLLFVFGPPTSLGVFASAFGFMNLAGVLTQLFFPNASPWYELTYGPVPADYSIPGEPGGLARIDEILGLDLYGSTFGNSPLVFGAFPSLHSGCATIEMLFVGYLFPRARPLAALYVLWMWFATMYLTHHYMIDLVGGSIYALVAFTIAYRFLPKINPAYRTRLDYLGVSKLSIKSFFYTIEHEMNQEKLPMTVMDTVTITTATTATRPHRSFSRPEPLVLSDIHKGKSRMYQRVNDSDEEEMIQSPALSPSSGFWSSTSEPASPITPHTPSISSSPRMHFNKS